MSEPRDPSAADLEPRREGAGEPVDVAFEPAPAAKPEPASRRSAGLLLWPVALLGLALGGAGLGLGLAERFGPAPPPGIAPGRLDALVADLARLEARIDALPTPRAPPPSVAPAELEALEAELATAVARLGNLETRVQGLARMVRAAPTPVPRPAAENARPAEPGGEPEALGPAPTPALVNPAPDAVAGVAEGATPPSPPPAEPAAAPAPAPEPGLTLADLAALGLADAADLDTLAADLGALEARVAAVESGLADTNARIPRAAPRTAATPHRLPADAPLALARLAAAAADDAPFPDALAAAKGSLAAAPGFAEVEAVAAVGAPSIESLAARFPEIARAVRAAAEPPQSLGTEIARALGGVIARPAADDPAAKVRLRLDAAAADLARGDLSSAVANLDSIDPGLRAAAQSWREEAGRRLALDAALAGLARAASEEP